jgi:hypothetical protein
LSLVQPYIGEGVNSGVEYLVRGVKGNILKTQGSRYIRFQLGRNTYQIIAPFPMKRDGILGRDILRALRPKVDFLTNQLVIDKEVFSLADVRLCTTDPGRARKMSSEERDSGYGQLRARVKPSEITTPPSKLFASGTADVPGPNLQDERSPKNVCWKGDRTCT